MGKTVRPEYKEPEQFISERAVLGEYRVPTERSDNYTENTESPYFHN